MLQRQPQRFRFDAAMRVLLHARRTADPAEAVAFRGDPGLGFPAAEITAVEAKEGKPRIATPLIGLMGTAGALPRLYGELAGLALRRGSPAPAAFVDLLAQRMIACFARAGIKYRLNRSMEAAALTQPPTTEPISAALLSLGGFGTPGLLPRLACGPEPPLHYAGLFATRPRSAERLAALLSDWLGGPVEVVQFAGSWLSLPHAERTSLPAGLSSGSWNCLGLDAVIGVCAWDPHSRIVLRLGPLDRAAFEALLPGRPAHVRLIALARAFLGREIGLAINPVLAREAVFPLRLAGQAQLSWNSWILPPGEPARKDAADAVFAVE
jgi:type VI secretion system protein ImpH